MLIADFGSRSLYILEGGIGFGICFTQGIRTSWLTGRYKIESKPKEVSPQQTGHGDLKGSFSYLECSSLFADVQRTKVLQESMVTKATATTHDNFTDGMNVVDVRFSIA